MIKQCVKKPFTVLVAVIVCLTLAAVSLTRMSTDLIPELSMPYMIVITTYPGATPEKVETNVTEPLERQLGTVSKVKNVTSTSSENYGMVMLEFEDDTNMDSALVKVNAAIQAATLPEECGTPNVMEISMDMMATEYLSIDFEGKDIYELSDFVEETVIPYYERQEGVSTVSDMGLVKKQVEIRLDEKKIDKLNDKLLAYVDKKLVDTKKEITDAQKDLEKAEEEVKKGSSELENEQQNTANQLGEATLGLNTALATKAAYEAELNSELANQAALQMELKAYEDAGLVDGYGQMNDMFAALKEAAGGQEAHDMIYEQIYRQMLIAAVQQVVDTQASIGIGGGAGGNDATPAPNPVPTPDSNPSETPTPAPDNRPEEGENTGSEEALPEEQPSQPDQPTEEAEGGENTDENQGNAAEAEQMKAVVQPLSFAEIVEMADEEDKQEAEAVIEPRAALTRERVVVTEENVDSILDSMDPLTAGTIRETCKVAAEAATQEQLRAIADQMPDSVADALANPDKLENAAALLEQQGQGEVASQLTLENLTQMDAIIHERIPNIKAELQNLEVEIAASKAVTEQVSGAVSEAMQNYSAVEAGKILAAAGFGSGSAQLAAAQSSVESGKTQLDSALESFEDARDTALKNANINALVEPSTLSSMIYAQNFAMPAGYIDDKEDNQWMLKVGDSFESVEELSNMLLCKIDGIGKVRLKDVAKITVIDNAGESYTKVNGNEGVVLSLFKGSTAGTSDVSKTINSASEELMEQYDGLHITALMDQGQYIGVFIGNIVQSMSLGAVLAVIVLAVFLKDILPTIVVAFSIPFSVLVAILLMYFGDISLNIMSMGGLSLGIGMLVDNSIVSMENIYRLRNRGLTAPRAAVQGGKQVEGAIVASTLTTVCVFLPLIFTDGMVRQLMLPFALTIAFSLIASLVVALTVVPTLASAILVKVKQKEHPLFDRLLEVYGSALDFCLKVKIVPLALAIALLLFSVVGVTKMGIVLIPDMASEQISVTVTMDEDDVEKEVGYATADEVMSRIIDIEGIKTVGAMNNVGALISSSMSSANYNRYGFYIIPDDDITTEKEINRICDEISQRTADVPGATVTTSASSMGSMSTLMGSGLELNIYGEDLDELLNISKEFEKMIAKVEGFEEVTNGQEEADKTLHLVINRDKAMKLGLTTAQIYGQIASHLTTETSAVTVTMDGYEMAVTIVDDRNLPTRETLLDEVYEATVTNKEGEQVKEEHKLSEFGKLETADGLQSISRQNNVRYLTVSAKTKEGYNTTKLTDQVKEVLDAYKMPRGYYYELSGEYENVTDMMTQMMKMMALGFLFVYLVMVAQFQSLLSPFIVLFTVPLAFTGGFIGLLMGGEQLSLIAMMGFLVLMGTVVNNGIVFVDYANQLRLGGMEKRPALIATGKTRMRPILMTAMTTILSMSALIFDRSTSAGMSKGMAIVVAGGLLYATLMTLFIIPVMYDILFRKQPRVIDVGSDEELDDVPDDAAEFIAQMNG